MTRRSTDPDDLGLANRAFIWLVCAILLLILWPFDLVQNARLHRRAKGDDSDQGADWGGEDSFVPNVNFIHNDNAGAAK